MTSQIIALLAQFIVLITHGEIPAIPINSTKDSGFILVQLVLGKYHDKLGRIYWTTISTLNFLNAS
jgi:hypothetical protein